jgi:hypothetical protein
MWGCKFFCFFQNDEEEEEKEVGMESLVNLTGVGM